MSYEYRVCKAGTREGRLKFLNDARSEGLEYVQGLGRHGPNLLDERPVLFRRVEPAHMSGPKVIVALDGTIVGQVPLTLREGSGPCRVSLYVEGRAAGMAVVSVDVGGEAVTVLEPNESAYWRGRAERAEAERDRVVAEAERLNDTFFAKACEQWGEQAGRELNRIVAQEFVQPDLDRVAGEMVSGTCECRVPEGSSDSTLFLGADGKVHQEPCAVAPKLDLTSKRSLVGIPK
jgi:hypothetical protein